MDFEWLKPPRFSAPSSTPDRRVVFWGSFLIIDKLTPYDLWEEIVEKQNRALAIVVAAMAWACRIIVAAAIHG
jgi:putative membrane protein